MSFRRPPRPSRLQQHSTASSHLLLPADSVPLERRPYGTPELVILPGQSLQEGQIEFIQPSEPAQPNPSRYASRDPQDVNMLSLNDTIYVSSKHPSDDVEGRLKEENRMRKALQWKRWEDDVIPSLLEPYLAILYSTQSLRNPAPRVQGLCPNSCGKSRLLNVACISFHKLENVQIHYCDCLPAPFQLISIGFFPCAPIAPTLAIDLNMLQFACELFTRVAPNNTAWSGALEAFLSSRHYKFATDDGLRRRFGNTLQWYSTLDDVMNFYVQGHVNDIQIQHMEGVLEDPHENNLAPAPGAKRQCPSLYLRRRCPLCFGGRTCHDPTFIADVIVCLDACFTQKRRKGERDPRHEHPATVFLPESEVKKTEDLVNTLRPPQGGKRKKTDSEDRLEKGMKVPNSVLDACEESFLAADEKREKASTQFFSDTGLMALLCRHDRVLWLANMTSKGERQYYAVALLHHLMQNLPENMTVGVLYDIGCQLHRSCEKWNFLGDSLKRVTFGISVFHAYGHQWPCQVVYHPRKCAGFGLTDGEGCERFWSSIRHLIPSLRVSGYHHRIYTIDAQVKYLDKKSLLGMGSWLVKKWTGSQSKKAEAETKLNDLGLSEDLLRAEWEKQVKEQTKPTIRYSKKSGQYAVEEILGLQEMEKIYRKQIATLEERQQDNNTEADHIELTLQLEEVYSKLESTCGKIQQKRSILSVDSRINLHKIIESKYLQLRLKAQGLKTRIRDHLRNRKFEFERLERSSRFSTSEGKIQSHIKSSLHHRQSKVQRLVKIFNDTCSEIQKLIEHGDAPLGAQTPTRIEKEGLFKLDVDDEIWQDIEADNSHGLVPAWIGDENIRNGIKALLEYDRCAEEEARILKEIQALGEWTQEEWACIQNCIDISDHDPALQYQFRIQLDNLKRLCFVWKKQIQTISLSPQQIFQSWGSCNEDLLGSVNSEDDFNAETMDTDRVSESGDDTESSDVWEEEIDAELLEQIEIFAITDAYHQEDESVVF